VQRCTARFVWADFFGEKEVDMTNAPPPPDWAAHSASVPALAGRPAGFWIRVVAAIIDSLAISLLAALMIGAIAGAVFLSGEQVRDVAVALGIFIGIIGLIVLGWLYEALMTSSPRGATFGKRAIGARIVRADGMQLSFGRATARHFAKVIVTPLLPFGLGFLLAAWTKGKRAIHDMIADTLVIKTD
jgi:uncharacterized RDD family membrane protein YckC